MLNTGLNGNKIVYQRLNATKCKNRPALVTQAYMCLGSREVQALQEREDINGHENKTISFVTFTLLYNVSYGRTVCREIGTSLTADLIYCPFPVVKIIFSIRGVYIIALCICKYIGKEFSHPHYVGYPESKFGWAIEKNKNLFPNYLYCHVMYIPYTTFRHSFHHC
jgi:hypothetical protein